MTVAIGLMRPDERAFVAFSWLKSYEHAEARHVQRPAYWRHFGALVDGLLDSCETLVARHPQDPTHCFGFVCFSPARTLHYLYVKQVMRDGRLEKHPLDIAAKLLEASIDTHLDRVTFTTSAWLKYAAKHGIQYEHDRTLVAVTRAAARRAPREEKAA
jgi:hypothetical protein